MTDRDAMLCSILSSPQDDVPRLIFADWCEENGEAARAEFIRVQVELARLEPDDIKRCLTPRRSHMGGEGAVGGLYKGTPFGPCNKCEACLRWASLSRREEELVRLKQFPELEVPILLERWTGRGAYRPDAFATPHRGFVSTITCSWSDWLRHEAALCWHPKQTVECPRCEGDGVSGYSGPRQNHPVGCSGCGGENRLYHKGTGRIPRPFVATAQPLEEVRLTDLPPALAESNLRHYSPVVEVDSMGPEGMVKWTRVKCETCDGTGEWSPTGREMDAQHCPACRGTPLNSWMCDKWPGLVIMMPTTDEYRRHADTSVQDVAAGLGAPPAAINHSQTWRYGAHGVT